MGRSGRIVASLCAVAVGVSVTASPVAAEYETKACKRVAAEWKKKHPHATLKQRKAEAQKLAITYSCNFTKNLKAL
jgi:hypothetical protein